MDYNQNILASEINKEYSLKTPNWNNLVYSLIANSGTGHSYKLEHTVWDTNDNKIESDIAWLTNLDSEKGALFKDLNKVKKINKITFKFQNRQLLEIINSWDQSIQDEFEQYLPKSKKGKIRAWYLPDDDKMQETEPRLKLPKAGVIPDITNLTFDKAFAELNKIVTYKDDPLWDGGAYSLMHNKDGWGGECNLWMYDSMESKENNCGADEVSCELEVTQEMKQLFLFIQEEYKKKNPTVPYDALFVTVQRDGKSYSTNFEQNSTEVYPAAPPMPEKITAAYLCENLQNCLAHNAPANYMWVWEVLKKTQTEDGQTQLEGAFYYSLQEDKSNPQTLKPGEYIYMYNVSEQLFDEFLKDTQGWREIVLYFSSEGKVSYKVLRK